MQKTNLCVDFGDYLGKIVLGTFLCPTNMIKEIYYGYKVNAYR